MMGHPKLARHLADQRFGNLRRLVEYKAAWRGRVVLLADRWSPTSKTCSCCSHRLSKLNLSVRAWVCPVCGTDHDRDVNAAKNVLAFATAGHAECYARGGLKTPTDPNPPNLSRNALGH